MTRVRLCSLSEVPAFGALGIDVTVGARVLPLVLFRRDGELYGYLNSCPHTGVRLEWRAHDFFDAAGTLLQCATHGALFVPDTGRCLAGPCRGQSLIPLALTAEDGSLYLEEPARIPCSARVRPR